MKRRPPALDSRRIILYVAGSLVVALLAVAWFAPRREETPGAPLPQLRAYRAATGVYAIPGRNEAPPEYVEAEARALEVKAPLAYTIYVDQATFETRAWRDLLQVGRVPLSRPPQVDFVREIAVLVWPVPSQAPDSLMRAPGLAVDALVMQHLALELRVRPDFGGAVPATPVHRGGIAPYGLFTIPRLSWPLPVPAPSVPPLLVTLTG